MGWHALDNKKQVKNNKPAKAFVKARKIYGDHMEDAPYNPVHRSRIFTNFKELRQIQNQKLARRRRYDRLMVILAMLTATLVYLYFAMIAS